MDPSIRLDFILGRIRVAPEEITPEEWQEIVKEAIRRSKPQLTYLPGFETVSGWLNCREQEYDFRQTPEEVLSFPEGMNPNTRLLFLAGVSHEIAGKLGSDGDFGARFVTRSDLFLDRDGRLVLSEARYKRLPQHGLGYRGHRSGILEVAEFSRFSYPDEVTLEKLLTKDTCRRILGSLYMIVSRAVEEREERLGNMRALMGSLESIVNRVEV